MTYLYLILLKIDLAVVKLLLINRDPRSASFSITDTQDLKSILFPILDKFSLNTTKGLFRLAFII